MNLYVYSPSASHQKYVKCWDVQIVNTINAFLFADAFSAI